MKNRVRGQVMHLNPPMMKKTSKKVRNGKTEAPKNMRKKNDRFVFLLMLERLPIRTPPMDHVLGLKKVILYQIQKVEVGTLTRLPLLDSAPSPAAPLAIPFAADFFGTMGTEKNRFSLASRSGASGG
jgi:hypothetical protein